MTVVIVQLVYYKSIQITELWQWTKIKDRNNIQTNKKTDKQTGKLTNRQKQKAAFIQIYTEKAINFFCSHNVWTFLMNEVPLYPGFMKTVIISILVGNGVCRHSFPKTTENYECCYHWSHRGLEGHVTGEKAACKELANIRKYLFKL